MAARRQDRFLERQRGAGTRQIKNTGFSLLFPGQENLPSSPLQPQKSGRWRKPPQPDLQPQRVTRQTPAPEGPVQSVAAKTLPNPRKRGRGKRHGETEKDELKHGDQSEAPLKKRRLNRIEKSNKTAALPNEVENDNQAEVQIKDSQEIGAKPDPLLTPKAKKRKKRKSIGQQSTIKAKPSSQSSIKPILEPKRRGRKPKAAQSVVYGTPEPPAYSRITTPAVQDGERSQEQIATEVNGEKRAIHPKADEIEKEAKVTSLESKKRKRKATTRPKPKEIVPKGDIPADGSSSVPAPEKPPKCIKPGPKKKVPAMSVEHEGQQGGDRSEIIRISERPVGDIGGNLLAVPDAETDISTKHVEKVPKRRRKKRISIGQQSLRSNKKSKNPMTPLRSTSRGFSVTQSSNVPASSTGTPPCVIVNTEAQPPAPEPKKKRGRPRKAGTALPSSSLAREKPSRPRTTQTVSSAKSPRSRKPPANTIPIIYYTPASPSPVIATSPPTPSSDSDPLSQPLTKPVINDLPPPTTINAIDVLSQITHEIISKTISPLSQATSSSANDPSQHTHYTKQQSIVDAYSQELGSQLFQLTNALNENTALSAKARKQAAEERRLKRELKSMKGERKNPGQKMMKKGDEREEMRLQELIGGIGEAVKKGWEMERTRKEKAAEETRLNETAPA